MLVITTPLNTKISRIVNKKLNLSGLVTRVVLNTKIKNLRTKYQLLVVSSKEKNRPTMLKY